MYEENYGKDKVKGDGKNCVSKDLEEVNKADVIVAIPEDSMGVSVELGWGSVQNKQMLVFVDKKVSSIRISEKYRSNFEHKNN